MSWCTDVPCACLQNMDVYGLTEVISVTPYPPCPWSPRAHLLVHRRCRSINITRATLAASCESIITFPVVLRTPGTDSDRRRDFQSRMNGGVRERTEQRCAHDFQYREREDERTGAARGQHATMSSIMQQCPVSIRVHSPTVETQSSLQRVLL